MAEFAVAGWIPLAEGGPLPDVGTSVILSVRMDHPMFGSDPARQLEIAEWLGDRFDGVRVWCAPSYRAQDYDNGLPSRAVAWMPAPEPYTGREP